MCRCKGSPAVSTTGASCASEDINHVSSGQTQDLAVCRGCGRITDLHAGRVPIVSKSDDHHAFLFRQDGLVDLDGTGVGPKAGERTHAKPRPGATGAREGLIEGQPRRSNRRQS